MVEVYYIVFEHEFCRTVRNDVKFLTRNIQQFINDELCNIRFLGLGDSSCGYGLLYIDLNINFQNFQKFHIFDQKYSTFSENRTG